MPFGGWVSDRFSPASVLVLWGVGRTLLALALAFIVFLVHQPSSKSDLGELLMYGVLERLYPHLSMRLGV